MATSEQSSAHTPSPLYSCISFVIFGASGDLARRKTFPAIFNLYRYGFLSDAPFYVVGYARSSLSHDEFVDRVTSHIKINHAHEQDVKLLREFKTLLFYKNGVYDKDKDYDSLNDYMNEKTRSIVRAAPKEPSLRVFYLALPPEVFVSVAKGIKLHLTREPEKHIARVVIEKPFGRDLGSYHALSAELSRLFSEQEIFRIDHYLGKEMIKNVSVLRFGNTFFSSIWDASNIANVQITFKEALGVEGRGSYFDNYGIIRDVMQNHILQMLTMIAMETPKSLDSEHIRDEKVNVLKCISPIPRDNVVLGQYTESLNGSMAAYREDSTVDADSITPTFALALVYIDHPRWKGVPFFLKCGKGLNESKTEIRIQFKDVPNSLFSSQDISRNELVIRVSPSESVYLKLMLKEPGLEFKTMISELDLTYQSRYNSTRIPDAYESLILDILKNDHSNFVRDDELEHAWRIFTPLLHQIEAERLTPEFYHAGTRGPKMVDVFVETHGYRRGEKTYTWEPPKHRL